MSGNLPDNSRSNPFENFTICLGFSGGGLRATLFHLGVLRFLKQQGHINKISHITSVSGGSITAGHILQNWDQYANGDDSQFTAAANNLIQGAARYGIREHIAYSFYSPRRRFTQLHSCYVKGIARDRRDSKLRDVLKTPEFHILGTDFSTGRLVSFSRNGISLFGVNDDGTLFEHRPARNLKDSEFGLWEAVACSSAFPPMFPPHLIVPADYASEGAKNITIGDGGVYDNLGIGLIDYLEHQQPPEQNILFIVSDAGLPFENGLVSSSSYNWMLDRVTRASDIQFYRLADSDVRLFNRRIHDNVHRRLLTVRIGDIVSNAQDDNVLSEEVQKLVGSVRTDLDAFCNEEIHAVIQHGWELIRDQWTEKTGLQTEPKRSLEWQPGGSGITQDAMASRLKTSGHRKLCLRAFLFSWDALILLSVTLPFFALILFGLLSFFDFHLLDPSQYRRFKAIESGQVGVLSSWSYNLDKDEAIITVQSSKKPELVGRSYVVLIMKKPADRDPAEETKTMVSRIRKFQGIGGTVGEEYIPCPRIANTVQYGDPILFYLYVIPNKRLSNLQHAIDVQAEQPLTELRLIHEFGGVKMGGGMDGATFDENGKMIAPALEALERKRHPEK